MDMFNHRPLIEAEVPSKIPLGLVIYSSPARIEFKSQHIAEAGSELFMSYGMKKNMELFMVHGFIVENNPYDLMYIAILSDENDCSYYDPVQKACFFEIRKSFLSPDILNYIFYRLFSSHQSISSLEDLLSRQSKNPLFSKSNILKLLTTYRTLVQNNGVERCQPSFRETRRQLKQLNQSRVLHSINLLCLELDSIFISHLLRLDQAIFKSLLLDFPILKVK